VNVSGVGATPPPQPWPPVPPAGPAGGTSPDPRPQQSGTGTGGGRKGAKPAPEVKLPQAPPLRMLTVTEMRVMLGQLPASAAVRQASQVDLQATYS
jgi:hypothetical protein